MWAPRPQVLSLLLLALTMWLVCGRRYFWLPIVFLLWANLHGAVVMGVLVLAAALIATVVGESASHLPGLAFAVCGLSADDVGDSARLDVLDGDTAVSRTHSTARDIQEWSPPRLATLSLIPFWLIAVVLVGLTFARIRRLSRDVEACRRGYLTVCSCALGLLPLAFTAARNVPPFLLLAVPAMR